MTPPPPLPYAPRRRRPLSLWNPLDYLVLLYWVFYFPQALRWYVETFAQLPADANGWQAVRQDAIQRRLALQGLLASIVTTFGFVFFLGELGFQIDWTGVAFGVAFGVAVGVAGGVAFGVAVGVAVGVAFGVAYGVAGGVAFGVAVLRIDAALIGLIPAWLQPSKRLAITLQRASPLPVWGLHRRLARQLRENWRRGLDDCEGLLRYSLQFGPVIAAIQEALQNTPDERLLSRIADWCGTTLYAWNAVYYQSASLSAALKQNFWDEFFIVPRRWRPQIVVTLRYDTPARAACAGFWLLHQGELDEAANAFAAVRLLPHGEELYNNAQALAAAGNCRTLEQIAAWQSPAPPQGASLRPQVRAAFDRLAEVAKDIDLVLHARSSRQRNSALNRASGRLHDFSAEVVDCPTPERPQLEIIAARWLDIILASAGAVGSLEVREPVASPYIVGAPVPAARLAGRQDVLARIEAAWAKSGPRDSLVIFGHRRMGKTSVARAVPHFCGLGDDTRLAFLNLQIVDWTEGLSDLCHAIAFALWEADPNGLDEPMSEDYEQHPLATLRRLLSRLGQSTPPRRYILVLDEYELLEEKLPDAVAGDRTALLRGLTQQHTWLALGLVGLHSLQERSASLREAIFGWRPIPVGLVDRVALLRWQRRINGLRRNLS